MTRKRTLKLNIGTKLEYKNMFKLSLGSSWGAVKASSLQVRNEDVSIVV